MSESFSVGEIAIVVVGAEAQEDLAKYWGEEVEILSRVWGDYEVKARDGRVFYSKPEGLRKKKPPEQLSDWGEIEKLTRWHPNRVNA